MSINLGNWSLNDYDKNYTDGHSEVEISSWKTHGTVRVLSAQVKGTRCQKSNATNYLPKMTISRRLPVPIKACGSVRAGFEDLAVIMSGRSRGEGGGGAQQVRALLKFDKLYMFFG